MPEQGLASGALRWSSINPPRQSCYRIGPHSSLSACDHSHFATDPVSDSIWLAAVIADHARYRLFLSQRGESAQVLLDLVQAVRIQLPLSSTPV